MALNDLAGRAPIEERNVSIRIFPAKDGCIAIYGELVTNGASMCIQLLASNTQRVFTDRSFELNKEI